MDVDCRRELRAWLVLARTPELGGARLRTLVEQCGSARAIVETTPARLEKFGLSPRALEYLTRSDPSRVESDLAWAAGPARHIVGLTHPAYPRQLAGMPDPPVLLFVEGDLATLNRPQIAIVGSRNPTPGGRETAFEFAKAIANAGICVTSGLATGIDAGAHRGALAADGFTIGVKGCGADIAYPARHRELEQQVAKHGALVTEFPPGSPPRRANFPQRNRTIAALSLGVLVVEAAPRSGSLITARFAMEYGREVFAIPGSIHSPLARGCHALIRQGAKLVETVADVFEEIGSQLPRNDATEEAIPRATSDLNLDRDYSRLLSSIGFDPTSIDTLVQRTGLTAEVVSSMLLRLELGGYVVLISGGRYARTARNP